MASEGDETERTVVKTYVPRYQKEIWTDQADELGMSQSEFVRTMVQAGRRGFDGGGASERSDPQGPNAEDGDPAGSDGGDGDGLDDRVLSVLDGEEYLDWESLVESLTGDIESRLEDALQQLQSRDEVRYSGRHGGYTRVDG
ncbi:hypothetical protein G9464_19195 [Halostella sp. JP-L12]|uniref:DUF5805 domain-containing protein n=1 Tax=Halostella TaxID=1843185 RepID=UPI000EF827EA|nr:MULTISPECIES: DUF5805 domain-containing protein [Halostella]NHN49699.1 hypothetical protein [Halostella sp. JP-L12]